MTRIHKKLVYKVPNALHGPTTVEDFELCLSSTTKTMTTEGSLPEEMLAAQVPSFGTPSVITVTKVPTPQPPSKTQLLIKVVAVSLSPSDYRILTGACSLVKKPKQFPYIPGGDISGTVQQVHETETEYKVGDRVFATWDTLGFGGLAEYALVEKKLVYRIPDDINFLQAAAMADSPVNAMLAVGDAGVTEGDRVLILGGSGAVGTSAIQFSRQAGAAFIAVTSTDSELMNSLGVDRVIDYEKEKWYEIPEFRAHKFDVVIDMAEGESAWRRCGAVLKSSWDGGRFIAGVMNEWYIEIRTIPSFVKWFMKPVWRSLSSRGYWNWPKYTMLFPAPRGDSMERFLEKRRTGFNIILDKRCPWKFDNDGVRDAFEVMIERKGHGKVVIAIVE